MTHKLIKTENYLLVVDDSEIKVGDWIRWDNKISKAIDTAYLPTTKKIIAHLPLNHLPILKGVDLLPPYSRHQEDGVEQLANTMFRNKIDSLEEIHSDYILGVTEGYNKAREKYKYTEEDVIQLLHKTARKYFQEGREYKGNMAIAGDPLHGVRRELINMVQSLNQYPTEFESEMETIWVRNIDRSVPTKDDFDYKPKTITTAQGVQWVGKYKLAMKTIWHVFIYPIKIILRFLGNDGIHY